MTQKNLQLLPIEWGALPNIDEVSPINTTDEECLAELSRVLIKHGKEERFGISLIHKHFDLDDDEMMLEFCDSETRTLTTRPVKKINFPNSMETVWHFGSNGKGKAGRACYRSCWTDIHGNHNGNHQWGP